MPTYRNKRLAEDPVAAQERQRRAPPRWMTEHHKVCPGLRMPDPRSIPVYRSDDDRPIDAVQRARDARENHETYERQMREIQNLASEDLRDELKERHRLAAGGEPRVDWQGQPLKLPPAGLSPAQNAMMRMFWSTSSYIMLRTAWEAQGADEAPSDPRFAQIGRHVFSGDLPRMWPILKEMCEERGFWVPLKKYKIAVLAWEKELYDLPDKVWEEADEANDKADVLDGASMYEIVSGPLYFDQHMSAIKLAAEKYGVKRQRREWQEHYERTGRLVTRDAPWLGGRPSGNSTTKTPRHEAGGGAGNPAGEPGGRDARATTDAAAEPAYKSWDPASLFKPVRERKPSAAREAKTPVIPALHSPARNRSIPTSSASPRSRSCWRARVTGSLAARHPCRLSCGICTAAAPAPMPAPNPTLTLTNVSPRRRGEHRGRSLLNVAKHPPRMCRTGGTPVPQPKPVPPPASLPNPIRPHPRPNLRENLKPEANRKRRRSPAAPPGS